MYFKKIKKGIALSLVGAMCLGGYPVNKVNAATVKPKRIVVTNKAVVKNKVTMEKGAKLSLKLSFTPKKANKGVTYSTNKKSVATVSKKGVIKAVKKGTAKITIKSKVNKKVKTVVTVKVINKKNVVNKVTPKPISTVKPSPTAYVPQPSVTGEVPLVNINGKSLVIKSASVNSNDFTISVKVELNDGTSLDSFVPSEVRTILSQTKVKMTKGADIFVADYADYSFDTNTIKYKLTNSDAAKLQPSKNGLAVGTADGEYTISSSYMKGSVVVSYYESLVGNSLTGYVYDDETGKPLKGVKVTAYTSDSEKSMTTNADGYYKLALTSASYRIRASYDGEVKYFTQETTGKVSNNNNTGCNFSLSHYNENLLFISGVVQSDKNNQDLSGARVELYEVTTKGDKFMGYCSTSSTGAFVFGNSSHMATDEYKLFVKDVKSCVSKTFAKGKGLKSAGTYKIVISKTPERSVLDAHKTKTINNIQFANAKQYSLNTITLEAVQQLKEMNIQVKWSGKLPSLSGSNAKVKVMLYKRDEVDGIANGIQIGEVSLKVDADGKISENLDLVADNFFGGKPTLSTGRYYVGVSDNQSENADTYQAVNVTEGGKIEVNTIDISSAKTVTVVANCDVLNANSLIKCTPGKGVNVLSDIEGTTTGKTVKASYNLYQVIDGDKIPFSSDSNNDLVYNTSPITSITASTTFGKIGSGSTYCVSLVKSLISTDSTDLVFDQGNSVVSTKEFKVNGAADVKTVKVNASSLFTGANGSLQGSDKVKLEYVSLKNESGKEVGRYDLTETDDGFLEMTVDSAVAGIDIPQFVDGIETGMYGIAPSDIKAGTGKYTLGLKFKGYKEAVTDFSCIDFQEVTVNYKKEIDYIQETGITGSITLYGQDVQDNDSKTVDATVMILDANKQIVGYQTYGNNYEGSKAIRKFELLNEENAVLTGGKYTLVVRCVNPSAKQFDTFIKDVVLATGGLAQLDVTVNAGNNGSVMLGITDDNNNVLEKPDIYLLDEYSVFQENVTVSEELDSRYDILGLSNEWGGVYTVPQGKVATEFTRTENLSKGTYEVWVDSVGTGVTHIHDFTISSGQNHVKTGLKAKLLAGADQIPVTVSYKRDATIDDLGIFDIVTIEDESGNVVGMRFVSNYDYVAGETETVVVYVPNIPGNYKVVIYSNGSFLSKDILTIQGVSKEILINLVKASVN